jgi:hypothetical protein
MVGQTAELLVQERDELVESFTVTSSDLPKQRRDV